MKLKSHIWIELDDQTFIGSGRVKLLKAIHETGSMNKAAQSMEMSYKKAWTLVKSMDEMSKEAVVEKVIGGKGGGGAKLTEYGLKIIKCYDRINAKCWEFLENEEEYLKNELGI